jgi:hypothetical protein
MRISNLAVLVLVLGAMVACEKGEQNNVPYKACECEKEEFSLAAELSSGEAVLYVDLPQEQYNEKVHQSGKRVILYDTKEDTAALYGYLGIMHYASICNFPDFAKGWKVPKNGQKVHYEGTIYYACNPFGFADKVYSDIILNTLNRR